MFISCGSDRVATKTIWLCVCVCVWKREIFFLLYASCSQREGQEAAFVLEKVYRFACFLQQPNQLNWTFLTLMVKSTWLLMCSNLWIYSSAEYHEMYCVKCHTLAPFHSLTFGSDVENTTTYQIKFSKCFPHPFHLVEIEPVSDISWLCLCIFKQWTTDKVYRW